MTSFPGPRRAGSGGDTLLPALSTDADGAYGDYLRRGAPSATSRRASRLPSPDLPPPRGGAAARPPGGARGRGLRRRLARRPHRAPRRAGDDVPDGRLALKQLKTMVFGQFFGAFDEDGRNPAWEVIGFPARSRRRRRPSRRRRLIPIERVSGDDAALTADVCVVGSGAGGSVIAARLAQAAGRARAGERRLPQRGGLPPARVGSGAGCTSAAGSCGRTTARLGLLAGLHARRRHGHQLDGLPADTDDVRAEWAAEGSTGLDSGRVRRLPQRV